MDIRIKDVVVIAAGLYAASGLVTLTSRAAKAVKDSRTK